MWPLIALRLPGPVQRGRHRIAPNTGAIIRKKRQSLSREINVNAHDASYANAVRVRRAAKKADSKPPHSSANIPPTMLA
ncbi:hypothetical protein FACS189497_00520 [Betaproteobacteria bacterium]|nr:hypothetical protein FACS189488_11240 [Betaproteobacteria bacterium]GHU27405.1 hypothetical protein FACS189497_00520 [Betaproteobacteria bacterium]